MGRQSRPSSESGLGSEADAREVAPLGLRLRQGETCIVTALTFFVADGC
jgi:hypothetical protein